MKYSKELKAGIIVLVTLICFWLAFQYLKGRDVFTKGYVYYVNYDNVAGIQASKAVTMNGLKVGSIEEIESIPGENGSLRFTVKLRIDEEYRFNKSSIAEIYSPELMAGPEIRILLSKTPPLAQENDYIQGRIAPGLTDGLEPIKDNMGKVMMQLDSTLVVTTNVMRQIESGNLTHTLQNTNRTLKAFENTSEQATQLLSKNSDEINALLKDANLIMDGLNGTINKYGKVADKVNGLEVEKSLQSLEKTMGKVDQLLTNLNNEDGSLGLLMKDPSLYNNLNKTSENLNKLLVDFREHPKKYVNFSVFGKK